MRKREAKPSATDIPAHHAKLTMHIA